MSQKDAETLQAKRKPIENMEILVCRVSTQWGHLSVFNCKTPTEFENYKNALGIEA